MKGRALAVAVASVATAATNLWCASNDEASISEGGGLDGGPDTAWSSNDASSTATCTDAFCRVSLSEIEKVAINAFWVKDASEIWAVGSAGFAARFDGRRWRPIETGSPSAILAVAGDREGTVWGTTTGYGFFLLNQERDGGVEVRDAGFQAVVDGISSTGSEIFAVGASLRLVALPPADDFIWRYEPASGGGASAWRPISPPCPKVEGRVECLRFRAVWAESAERQWFVGDDGKIYRTDTSDGGAAEAGRISIAEMNSSSLRRFNAIWAADANDVWAVGVQGVVRHWTGGEAWETVTVPATTDLHGVWGSRRDDVWTVGDEGVVLHWDGVSWSRVDVPLMPGDRPTFYAVTAVGDDVWIGGEATLLRSTRGKGGDQ